jgi:betaine-homocysteine S-methyltransferase
MHQADVTREDWGVVDACKRLADAGADVVGLNCIRGPATMMPLLREIRAAVKTHIAALPVPYRTSEREPSFQSLRDAHWHYDEGPAVPGRPRPVHVQSLRDRRFGRRRSASASAISACAAAPDPTTFARWPRPSASVPPAANTRADMSKHAFLGSHERHQEGSEGLREQALAIRLAGRDGPATADRSSLGL